MATPCCDIRSNRLTRFLSPEQLKRLKDEMVWKKVQANATVFQTGDPAEYLFYIEQGCVKTMKTTSDGQEITFALKGGGDLIGLADVLSDSFPAYGHSAVAFTDTLLGVIHKNDLDALLVQSPSLSMAFMQWLALEQRIMQTILRDIVLHGKPGALSSVLIRLSNSYGQQTDRGIRISLRLTNQELAHLIGATRESVNRVLCRLKSERVISVDHGHLVIHDLDRLKDEAHCEDCPLEVCVI
jgi:CRP/FNR family transcriptional regulator